METRRVFVHHPDGEVLEVTDILLTEHIGAWKNTIRQDFGFTGGWLREGSRVFSDSSTFQDTPNTRLDFVGCSKRPTPAGVSQYIPTPATEIRTLSNFPMMSDIRLKYGDLHTVITVIVDSACQEELTLEPADVLSLNLPCIDTRRVLYPDGSTGAATVYDNVIVEVTLSNGSIIEALVAPIASEKIDDRVGAEATQRILGLSALKKLNLKLDYRSKRLTKRIRRI